MKVCTKCFIPKEEKEFNRNARAVDGLTWDCRACVNKRAAEYRSRPEIKARWRAPGGYADTFEAKLERDKKRFWDQVKAEVGSCWLWQGPKSSDGYGRFNSRAYGKRFRAHRFAWLATFGTLPEELHGCHKCDTPLCVRPDHLFMGTARENSHDAQQKGRLSVPGKGLKGAANKRAKLTETDVVAIRQAYADGVSKIPGLARRYGVSTTVIHHVVTRKSWKHIQ
jgi:hypothetical protein